MNPIIVRPAAGEYAERYMYYVGLVPTNDIITELQNQQEAFIAFIRNTPDNKMNFRYAEGKWTIADIYQHLIDTERIYVFRMLNFVRNGMMEIPGFDQDEFANHADTSKRSKQSFVDEFEAVRKCTIEFLKTITPDQSMIIGKANNATVSVRAMAYVAYGHVAHHCGVILEKYLAGVSSN